MTWDHSSGGLLGRSGPYPMTQAFVRSGIGALERPSTWSILLLLAFFLLPVSLIPSTAGRFFRVPPLPQAWWSDYLLLLFVMVVLLYRAFGFSSRINRSTFRWFLLPFLLLGLWQVVSLAWNGQDGGMRQYSFLQTVAMCSAVLGGVLLCSGLSFHARMKLGRGLTVLVAFIAAVYLGLSFLFPGLRPSTAWMERTAEGLGFIRMFGPLGKATTLNFVLVPALGFSLGQAFSRGWGRPFWIVTTCFFVLCIVATGSRLGLLSLGFFCLLLLLSVRLRATLLLLPVAVALAGVFLAIGVPERFRQLHQDEARSETYKAALRAYAANPRNVLLGAGHGALYSKLHDDSLRKIYQEERWFLLAEETQYGFSLRNSHSAILRSLAETGPAGLLLTIIPLTWLMFRPRTPAFRAAPRPQRVVLLAALAGCAGVIPAMLVEEFFISAFWIVVLWTMYVVIAAEGYPVSGVASPPRGRH